MKLLIISTLVAFAAAGTLPEVQIKSIVLPEPMIPKVETAYIPRPEPISFGMIMVPQEVLDAVAAEQQVDAEVPVEPVNIDNLIVKVVDNVEVEPVQIVDLPAFEPISAGELETIRVAMPEAIELLNEVEPLKVVDAQIEDVQNNQETIVEPVKFVDAPLPEIQALYPHLRFPDPYLR